MPLEGRISEDQLSALVRAESRVNSRRSLQKLKASCKLHKLLNDLKTSLLLLLNDVSNRRHFLSNNDLNSKLD